MAAVSLKRINKFALGEARTHKKFFVITNIILGMGGLLYLFMSSWSRYDEFAEGDTAGRRVIVEFVPSGLGLFLLGVGCCIGLMGAASVFRDMNSVQLGDVQLSLPMTASERYYSKLLALCYLHIFPIVVWLGVPSLVNWARCRSEEARFAEYIPTIFLAMLAGALFINCITVLCSVCCGALAESVYFTIIAIVCLSMAPAVLWYTLMETCAGHNADPGMAFSAWTFSFVLNVDNIDYDTSMFNLMLMLNCAVSAVVMMLTQFIYRRRDARSVGTPIANRVFFECIMFLGLATVYGLFFFRAELYIGIIIVSVIYVVIHVISSRGKLTVKKFAGWLLKFGLSTAAYVLLAGAAYATGGFGMVKHLPAQELKNGYIELTVYTDDDPTDGLDRYATFRLGELTPDSPDKASDAQIREAARVFQKHAANRERSAEEFFSELNGNRYYRSMIGTNLCRMTIYECGYVKTETGRERVVKDVVLSQRIEFNNKEASALAEELRSLGYLREGEEPHNEYRYDY